MAEPSFERIEISEARKRLPELTSRANLNGHSFDITKYGKTVARLLPPEDIVEAVAHEADKIMGKRSADKPDPRNAWPLGIDQAKAIDILTAAFPDSYGGRKR